MHNSRSSTSRQQHSQGQQWHSTAAFLCALLGASLLGCATAQKSAKTVPNPIGCDCSDVEVRNDFDGPRSEYTCLQQVEYGNCEQDFMLHTIKEIPEGHCQISCGRCSCCPTFVSAAKASGKLSELLWALNITGLQPDFEKPGYMASLLAPSDAAFKAFYDNAGLTRESIQKEDRQRSLLATVLQYHVLPPLKGSGAVWSAPFMRPGEKLATALPDGSTITVAGGEGEGASLSDYHPVKLVAPKSSAEIEVPDIYVCKGFIHIINQVLLPLDAKAGVHDVGKEAYELPGDCMAEAHAFYGGDVIKAGQDNVVEGAGKCCEACKKEKDCNVWVYCGARDKCYDGSGKEYPHGACELRYQEALRDEATKYAVALYRGLHYQFISGQSRKSVADLARAVSGR